MYPRETEGLHYTGVGLLKRCELKLHIDESVKPVAQPVCRIPFGLRQKVERKFDQFLELVIIGEVPLSWAFRMDFTFGSCS